MNRTNTRRTSTLGAVALTAALVLTGCFSGGGGGAGPSPEEGDGRIALAMLQPPRSGLTPLSDDAFKLTRWSTVESLVSLDDAGDAQPALATDWTQSDDTTWDLTIREGVLFHDGTTLDAAAVVNALQNALHASPRPRVLDGYELTAEAVDDMTVRIVTGTPDPILPQRLSSPQLVILAASAYGDDGTVDPTGTGTGPFELTEIGGTSTATLERFDDYWGGPAEAAGIDVTYVNDGAARGAALRTGAADIVEAIPVSQLALLDQALLHEVPMPRTNAVYFNNGEGVFADQAMRAAARAALDPESIVENVYEGHADITGGLFGPALPWAEDVRGDIASSVAPADPAGATITLATYSDRAELPEVAVLVEQQLEAAGFEVRQDVREYANFEPDALEGDFDAIIFSRAVLLETGDPVAYLTSDYSCAGTFNFAQLCDPEIDRLIAAASAAEPGEERQKAIAAVEEAILQADALAPLLHERVVQGEGEGVAGALRDPRERRLITEDTTAP
ncbi:ABC transporter substrate-binding protein [Microbacterium betulae]|uniref:ABC transporter substrate-binding protein n=1 Tax=Microbacterium betulae TaxID=2981139 RepID=A0AA97I6Q0_9MICO|nr:ABC transporter substrate-binding protein [Microbacterium sp. AB]WOF23382.1 ABC transporter substrate-binding protein [Microbacterium sp. AB]